MESVPLITERITYILVVSFNGSSRMSYVYAPHQQFGRFPHGMPLSISIENNNLSPNRFVAWNPPQYMTCRGLYRTSDTALQPTMNLRKMIWNSTPYQYPRNIPYYEEDWPNDFSEEIRYFFSYWTFLRYLCVGQCTFQNIARFCMLVRAYE